MDLHTAAGAPQPSLRLRHLWSGRTTHARTHATVARLVQETDLTPAAHLPPLPRTLSDCWHHCTDRAGHHASLQLRTSSQVFSMRGTTVPAWLIPALVDQNP